MEGVVFPMSKTKKILIGISLFIILLACIFVFTRPDSRVVIDPQATIDSIDVQVSAIKDKTESDFTQKALDILKGFKKKE
jgi:hypothetical protein